MIFSEASRLLSASSFSFFKFLYENVKCVFCITFSGGNAGFQKLVLEQMSVCLVPLDFWFILLEHINMITPLRVLGFRYIEFPCNSCLITNLHLYSKNFAFSDLCLALKFSAVLAFNWVLYRLSKRLYWSINWAVCLLNSVFIMLLCRVLLFLYWPFYFYFVQYGQ